MHAETARQPSLIMKLPDTCDNRFTGGSNALLREGGSGVGEEARDIVEHSLAHAYELALLPPV